MEKIDVSHYPQCLLDMMGKLRIEPTGNLEWDKTMMNTLRQQYSEKARFEAMKIRPFVERADADAKAQTQVYPDLADPGVLTLHKHLFTKICNEHVLSPQHRQFIFDDRNKDIILFLLYYFNNSELAETVFPERGYKLHKNIMLQGPRGVGKTILMQCFSTYLRYIRSPRAFYNVSVSRMVNYFTKHSNLDLFTFNEENTKGFQCRPENVCLNDIGMDAELVFFGTKTSVLADEFLKARNDIWQDYGKFAHLTTNLDNKAIKERFKDDYDRINDRFKTYNVVPMTGESRR